MFAGYHVPNLSYWQALGSITPLSLSWLSFLAALRSARNQSSHRRNCNGFTTESSTNRVPAGVTRRNDQLPGRCLPTPATLCELVFTDKPAPRRRDYATTSCDKSRVSNCSRMLAAASPALYRHGLLSKIALKKVFPSRPDSEGTPSTVDQHGQR